MTITFAGSDVDGAVSLEKTPALQAASSCRSRETGCPQFDRGVRRSNEVGKEG